MHKQYRFVAGMLVTAAAGTQVGAAEHGKTPNPTDGWNHTWNEVLIDLWLIGLFFGAIAIYMLIKFRARTDGEVGTAAALTFRQALAWCLVPAALFLADDFLLSAKGWSLWNVQRTVPAGAMEIKVTASQWAFTFEYPNGVEVSSTDRDEDEDLFSDKIMDGDMVVPVGKPIVLRMVSTDVIHSFGLNHYRLKEDIMPGRVTYLWFVAREPKISNVVCVEFCGVSHSQMFNRVVAVSKTEYEAWLAKLQEEAALQRSTLASLKITR